jgi:hypothetical protein
MKRIPRGRPLAPEDVTLYRAIRDQVVDEVPELIARHEARMSGFETTPGLAGNEESGGVARRLAPDQTNGPL